MIRTSKDRARLPGIVLLLLAMASADASAAAAAAPAPASASRRNGLAAGRAFFTEFEKALERDVIARMIARPTTPLDRRHRLEIEIDLRLLARNVFACGAGMPAGSDAQAAARLRGRLVLEAIGLIEAQLDRQRNQLTPAQVEATLRLNKLTFLELRTAKDLDSASRLLAGVVLGLAGPPGVDENKLPPVRPQAVRASPTDPLAAFNLPAMTEEINRLNVSVPLRQQLHALAGRAVNPPVAEQADKVKEAVVLMGALRDALVLAKALQNNTAVAADVRLGMESQLAEGLALFMDPRTRTLGTDRLAPLNAYRQTVARITRLNLTPEQHAQYAPLFLWVRNAGQQGQRVLASLDRYLQARGKFDARPKGPHPVATLHRPLGELEKQYAAARDRAAAILADIPRTPARSADLDPHVEEMLRVMEIIERLDALPSIMDTLGPYKPKPFGGIERRVTAAAMALAAPQPAAGAGGAATAEKARLEAAAFLADLHRLATLANQLAAVDLSGISATVQRKCAAGKLPDVKAKWQAVVADLATAAASGGEIDPKKVVRLTQAMDLYEAVKQAALLEAALAETGALERWVDWRMGLDALKPLFNPYMTAMADAFTGYVADSPGAVETWEKVEARYGPVVDLMIRTGAYAPECSVMPPLGPVNLASALATPMENAPFAAERFTAFCMDLYKQRSDAGDTEGALAILAAYFNRINE